MSQPPPQGYLNRKIAESVQDAIGHYSVDHIKTIVKASIQRYIESFMQTEGGNRSLFAAMTKQGLQFVVDKSFDPASDSTLRKLQVARLFEQIRKQLPCLLIVDSSFNFVPTNWIGMDRTWVKGREWHTSIHIARSLNISIVGGARDQSTADFLHGLISVLFGEMRFIAGGNSIGGNIRNGETWRMTMGNPVVGKISEDMVTDDPKDKIWFFEIEIPDILFEDNILIKQDIGQTRFGEGIMNPDDGYLGNIPPRIEFPNQIRIDEPTMLLIDLLRPNYHRIFVSDPNVAVYNPDTRMITARRAGTFEIQIMRPLQKALNEVYGEQTGRDLEVVARKSVTVTRL